jgi:hypothetical protein
MHGGFPLNNLTINTLNVSNNGKIKMPTATAGTALNAYGEPWI